MGFFVTNGMAGDHSLRRATGDEGRLALVHRIRNFGEDLYRLFRHSGEARIDIPEVDRATNVLVVRDIKTRKVRAISAQIWKVLDSCNLGAHGHLSKSRAT